MEIPNHKSKHKKMENKKQFMTTPKILSPLFTGEKATITFLEQNKQKIRAHLRVPPTRPKIT